MKTKNTAELIPLTLNITASVEANNLAEYMAPAREWLASINRSPSSDEEFGQAELDVKGLKAMEDLLRSEKERAISAAEDVQRTLQQFDDASEELRAARLELEKVIAARKEEVKNELIEEALATFDMDPADARKFYLSGLQTSIKGKRTLDSMKTALRVYATTQQAVITTNRKSIESFESAHGVEMTMDRRELEVKSSEYVTGELRRRFEAKKAADERKRLEEEAAKAKTAAELAKREADAVKREVEAAKQPAKPEPLPAPPKIGSIPVGSAARAEANVVPFQLEPQAETITEDDEWKAITATVKAAFGLIKEHRERLVHEANVNRMAAFGQGVNALWKELNAKEASA